MVGEPIDLSAERERRRRKEVFLVDIPGPHDELLDGIEYLRRAIDILDSQEGYVKMRVSADQHAGAMAGFEEALDGLERYLQQREEDD